MYWSTSIIYLVLFAETVYGEFEDRPTYGYLMRYGIPKVLKLQIAEHLRIIGGTPVAKADAIPYQAGIITTLTTGRTSICGGSLVSTTRVLTAAHCWWDGQNQASHFTVVLGSLTIFSGGTRIVTTDVRVHPEWKVNMVHDIAMVGITIVAVNSNIQVIPLPTKDEQHLSFVGFTGTISGFGKTCDAQNTFKPTTSLHQTKVTVITNTMCQKSYTIPIQESHICSSGDNGKGSFDGDSGGPLTVIHNNKRILVGVVSFGHTAGCEARMPSVFTRVTDYLSWIQSQL